jgi:HSP20 family molecular chaperone IbpA
VAQQCRGALDRRGSLAGRFDRAVTMPIEINPDGVKAEYRDGILALFLPRAESDKPKSIKVAWDVSATRSQEGQDHGRETGTPRARKEGAVGEGGEDHPRPLYVPYADIYETDEALAVVMEMPGVEKKDLNVALENDALRVDGQIDFRKYKEMEPVYTEYNIGHCARSFTLSNKVDQD